MTAPMSPRRRRRNRAAGSTGRNQSAPSAEPSGAQPHQRVYPLDFAGPVTRLYAFSVDLSVLFMLFAILNLLTQGRFASAAAAPQDIFVFFGYFVLLTGIFGQTPGKFVAGIVVVDREGRTPGVGVAIPREMIGKFVSIIALGIGLLWILYDPSRQGWHDKIAGTYVVRKADAGVPGVLGRLFRRDRKPGGS
jgi:uncharacterized RDD family membrane protein YckC